MAKITIDKDKCKGCLLCIAFCPRGKITVGKRLNRRGVKPAIFSRQSNLSKDGIPPNSENSSSECLGCSLCAIICPDCCIEVYK